MTKLPITFVFMTSTKPHFGHVTYLDTLSHYDRQLPLSQYAALVAHIKITPGDETKGAEMARELGSRGFEVLTSVANWSRGQSHQNEYLLDQIKVSKQKDIYLHPYIFFVEDDSPVLLSGARTLDQMLSTMCTVLADPDVLSVRFMRENDWPPAGQYEVFHSEWLRHEHLNFQPLIMRSHQFYTMLKTAEDNLAAASSIQIEMLWRLILAPYSRAALPHHVIRHEVGRALHLGTPDYLKTKASLNL